jgi:RNA polymerase sigma-70 factor (ECF subfamily)
VPFDPDTIIRRSGEFPSTHWSLVIQAGSTRSPEAAAALAELCDAYWYPIYAFIRRKGNHHDKALDLTQSYFARLLEKPVIAAADRSKGRFRSFLRTDCQHFLISEYRGQKNKPSARAISIDGDEAQRRYRIEPADLMTPDRIFDRAWAMTLLDRALERLAAEFATKGRSEVFDHLKVALTQGKGAVAAAALAARLGITENAVNVAIHRLKKRYREILMEYIAATLDDASQSDDEIRSLIAALRF